MTAILDDIRGACRRLRRQPLLSAVVILTMGLGIGLATLVFTAVDTLVLRPLPYDGGDSLVVLRAAVSRPGRGDGESEAGKVSLPTFADWRASAPGFETMAAFESTRQTLTGEGDAEMLAGYGVSGGFWGVYRVRAARGRLFDPVDARDAGAIVISDALWRRRFGASADVLGRRVAIDGTPRTIVGVLPAGFRFFEEQRTDLRKGRTPSDVITPLAQRPWAGDRRARWLDVIGRLRAGVGLDAARDGMSVVAKRLSQAYPGQEGGVDVISMRQAASSEARSPALLLSLSAAFVLLIACANVAGLLLSSGSARYDDVVLMHALGATRGRIVRQSLAESVVLGLAGGVLGVILAARACALLDLLRLDSAVSLPPLAVDVRVLLFAVALAAASGIAFGIAPALAAAKPSAVESRTGKSTAGRRESRFQQSLVAAEVALTLVLGVGAGLLLNSFVRLSLVEPGFRPGGVLTASVRLGESYRAPDRQKAFFAELLSALRRTPGIGGAAATSGVPLAADRTHPRVLTIEGRPAGGRELSEQEVLLASDSYFGLMSIPLLAGRSFDERDADAGTRVAIVNESLARVAWGRTPAVGRRISIGSGWMTVVGIVGDVRRRGLGEPAHPEVYIPFAQADRCPRMSLVIRADGDPSAVWPLVRKAIRSVDANQALIDAKTLEQAMWDHVAGRRLLTTLVGVFAGAGLLLAFLGLYGLIAFTVNRRAREIAIRIAVGGEPGRISRAVLARAAAIPALGVPLGLVGAWALNSTVSGLLFGIGPLDPLTFVVAAAVVVLVSLGACIRPARRARRLDPLAMLRCE